MVTVNLAPLSVQAYTEKKVMAFEEVDTPETHDAAFMMVNKVLYSPPTVSRIYQTVVQ